MAKGQDRKDDKGCSGVICGKGRTGPETRMIWNRMESRRKEKAKGGEQ